jgi:hypothetical protein
LIIGIGLALFLFWGYTAYIEHHATQKANNEVEVNNANTVIDYVEKNAKARANRPDFDGLYGKLREGTY